MGKKRTSREIDNIYVKTNELRRNTDITIIYPEEKIIIPAGQKVDTAIRSTIHFYHSLIQDGLMKWNGQTMECRIKQMRLLVKRHFYIDSDIVSEKELDTLIEKILYIRK